MIPYNKTNCAYVQNLPANLVDGFRWDAGAPDSLVDKIKNCNTKLVFSVNGKQVGFASADLRDDKTLDVQGFYVEYDYRKQGIGTILLRRLLLKAMKEQCQDIWSNNMSISTCSLFIKLQDRLAHNHSLTFKYNFWYDSYGYERVYGQVNLINHCKKI